MATGYVEKSTKPWEPESAAAQDFPFPRNNLSSENSMFLNSMLYEKGLSGTFGVFFLLLFFLPGISNYSQYHMMDFSPVNQ